MNNSLFIKNDLIQNHFIPLLIKNNTYVDNEQKFLIIDVSLDKTQQNIAVRLCGHVEIEKLTDWEEQE